MCALWALVLAEVRWHYDSGVPLPYMPGGRGGTIGPGMQCSAKERAGEQEIDISGALLY